VSAQHLLWEGIIVLDIVLASEYSDQMGLRRPQNLHGFAPQHKMGLEVVVLSVTMKLEKAVYCADIVPLDFKSPRCTEVGTLPLEKAIREMGRLWLTSAHYRP
jgi:hypothetical protein